jgi:hypothetical protein
MQYGEASSHDETKHVKSRLKKGSPPVPVVIAPRQGGEKLATVSVAAVTRRPPNE